MSRSNLIGEPNGGRTQAKFPLGDERTHNAFIGMLKRYLARIPGIIKAELSEGLSNTAAAEFMRKHALLEIDVDALEWSVLRVLDGEPGLLLAAATSGLKVRGSEYLMRAASLEMEILGPQAAPGFSPNDAFPLQAGAPSSAPGRAKQYFYWHADTIFGATNEIQRNIIWSTLARP